MKATSPHCATVSIKVPLWLPVPFECYPCGEKQGASYNIMFSPAQNIRLHIAVPQTYNQEQISQVIVNNKEVGIPVPAAYIEVAYYWKKHFLLVFATADIPFEEVLYIYLFELETNKLIDQAWTLGSREGGGFFSSPKIKNLNTISFMFEGEHEWCVTLFDSPRFMIRKFFSKYAFLVSRPFSLKRYMQITYNNIKN